MDGLATDEATLEAPASAPGLLRLLAQDQEDLQVISAALQDAIAHAGDIRYEPAARRLTILFNRFRWEACAASRCERVYAALQFGDVMRVRQRGLQGDDRGALVSCLALDFEPCTPPGGAVVLRFSHGGDLRIDVDCIDAVLADVSEPWSAVRRPEHQAVDAEEEMTSAQEAAGWRAVGEDG